MKKLLIITIIAFNAITIFAQTQKYDNLSYTLPKGWVIEDEENNGVTLSAQTKSNTKFCSMFLKTTRIEGEGRENFDYVWKNTVHKQLGANINPVMSRIDEAKSSIFRGSARFNFHGQPSTVLVNTRTLPDKVIAVFAIFNSEPCRVSIQKFFNGIAVEKKPVVEDKK